jgi:hypothetical protein
MAIAAGHRPPQAMYAALGEPGLTGDLANTGLGVLTKGVENQAAFGPISHVGRSSAGVTKLVVEFSPVEYMADTKLSRLTGIPYSPIHLAWNSPTTYVMI